MPATTIKTLLRRYVDHPWLAGLRATWPWGLHGNLPPGDDPDRRRLRCVGARQVRRGTDLKQWRLQLRDDVAKVDVDVTLTLRIGSGRRAASVIEYEGTLTYTGKGKGAHIEAISSLDWAIDAQELGEPHIRTGCAGPFIDVA